MRAQVIAAEASSTGRAALVAKAAALVLMVHCGNGHEPACPIDVHHES